MDQYDKLKAELMKKEWEWEDIEHEQRKAQKQLEEQYENIGEITQRLNHILDEKYQEVMWDLRRVGDVAEDMRILLNNGMTEWYAQIDQARYSSLQRLDQKQEELDLHYKRQYRKLQDDIDGIYSKYRE